MRQHIRAIITCLSLCLISPASHAEERSVDFYYYSGPVYSDMNDIPEALRDELMSKAVESYVSRHLRHIRRFDAEKHNTLTHQGLAETTTASLNRERGRQMRRLIQYERNFDGKVTEQEVRDFLTIDKRYKPSSVERSLQRVMKADTDSDGVISLEEMTPLYDENARREPNVKIKAYTRYLALDPNGDGRLTLKELTNLAHKAFATIDTDGNGWMSKDEYLSYADAVGIDTTTGYRRYR